MKSAAQFIVDKHGSGARDVEMASPEAKKKHKITMVLVIPLFTCLITEYP